MALAERHRLAIYQSLSPIVGEEAMDAWMAQFPTREVDEPATKDFVAVKFGELRAEIAGLRGDLDTKVGGLRGDLDTKVGGLRGEMQAGFAELRREMEQQTNKILLWMLPSMAAMVALTQALARA